MTTMTQERPAVRPARAARRTGSGVGIDPAKLTELREAAGLSRQELCEAIAALWRNGHPDALPFTHREPQADGHRPYPVLAPVRDGEPKPKPWARVCQTCGQPVAGGLSPNAVAKIEYGERTPKPRTVRALCAALGKALGRRVRPAQLLPGSGGGTLPSGIQSRKAVARYNQGMRDYADSIGRKDLYINPAGRIFYRVALIRAYEAHLAQQAAAAAAPDALAS